MKQYGPFHPLAFPWYKPTRNTITKKAETKKEAKAIETVRKKERKKKNANSCSNATIGNNK